jgi:hypothetical protein
LTYAPPISTNALLPLHYIKFFSIAFNIFLFGFVTGQLRSRSAMPRPVVPRRSRAATSHDPGVAGHGPGRPQPPTSLPRHGPGRPLPPRPRNGQAPTSCSQPRGDPGQLRPGRGRPRNSCSKVVAGCSRLHQGRGWPCPGCTKAMAGQAPTINS